MKNAGHLECIRIMGVSVREEVTKSSLKIVYVLQVLDRDAAATPEMYPARLLFLGQQFLHQMRVECLESYVHALRLRAGEHDAYIARHGTPLQLRRTAFSQPRPIVSVLLLLLGGIPQIGAIEAHILGDDRQTHFLPLRWVEHGRRRDVEPVHVTELIVDDVHVAVIPIDVGMHVPRDVDNEMLGECWRSMEKPV